MKANPVPKRTALVYLAIGSLLSAALIGFWYLARSRFALPGLSTNGGIILVILLFPAFVGFGHVTRSFRTPLRVGAAALALVIVLNVALITYSYSDRMDSKWQIAGLSLLWTLACAALWLLARTSRTAIRKDEADQDFV